MIIKRYILLVNKFKVVAITCLITFASLTSSPSVYANPTDGNVAAGSATITAPDANTVQVNQHSNKAIINWQSFNVGANETVRFVQPSAGSIAVNRVNPNNGASNIAGRITANGQIWILNPAGILITPTARIDAASFLATTAGISDADFMNGNYRFIQSQDWNGSVINQGSITVADAGMAALVAPAVNNSGVIQANLGEVVLATGNEFVVDFYGDELIHFTLNSTSNKVGVDQHGNEMEDAVSNSGEIIANGGKVVMAANTAVGIVRNNINMSGTIVAKTASVKNGVITLSGGGGRTKVTGKIIASGERAGEKGGKIKIEGKQVVIADNAKLDATGHNGGGEILMGGNAHGAGSEMRADFAYFGQHAVADASALTSGDGGKVVLWSDISTGFYGNIYARGGAASGNGGFVETSGKMLLESGGMVNASTANGAAGNWLLDPYNITISNATVNGSFSGGDPNVFTPSANTATVDVATINASLNGGTSVTIDTGGSGSPGAQAGDLTLTSAILKSSGVTTPTLTLNAFGALALNNNITATSGGLNVVLNGSNVTVGNTANSTITTLGGSFTGTAQNTFAIGNGVRVGSINTGSGTVTIFANADGASTQSFAMTAASTIVTTNATSSAVNITVNTSGGAGTGAATLAGITTGSGGTITVATNPGGNNGSNIAFVGTAPLDVGTGTVTLTTGVALARSIGTSGANILMIAGTLNATTSANGIFVTNTGTGTLSLGTVNTTGSMTLTSTASSGIVQSGILTVNGTANLVAGSTQDITLTNTSNNAGTLTITSGNNVSFTDSNALILGASNISGALNMTTGGTLTQSGVLTIAGTPTFTLTTALTDISLASQANNFSTTPVITSNGNVRDLFLRNINASAVAPTLPTGLRALTLTYNNAAGLVLPGVTLTGNLSVIANGTISQSGAIIANLSGTTQTFNAGAANNITLTNASNDFRNVLIPSANNVTLQTGTALIMGASTISGTFNLTTAGAVTSNGAVVVSGLTTLASGTTNNIAINSAGTNFSTVQINSGNAVTLLDTNSIILATSTTNGALTVTSSGAITQTGVITAGGTATFAAGAANNITLDTFTNNFTTAAFTSGNNVTLTDVNAVILGTSTISGSLSVTAGGSITQSGVLNVTGTPTFTLTTAVTDISLASQANNFATTPVVTNNGNVQDFLLRNTNAGATVPVLPTGLRNLTLTFNNATSLVLPDFSISGNLSTTANGAITQSGIAVVGGTATLAAGAANNITLTNASNNFGTVTITSGNNVSITDVNALILGAGTISGALNVTTSGALTQSAAVTVAGLTTLNANLNNITLSTSTNNFNSIAVTSGNNVSLRDTNSLIIAGITIDGTLTLQTNGALTQTGSITALGTTTLIAGAANDITLNSATNDFATVAVTSGLNVAITDVDDINLGVSTVSGTFGVTAGSHITQTGILTITGVSTFTASAAGTDVLLASAANVFTATPVFTNNGNIRDLALRRTGAGVALPIFPTGLRNLTLIYNSAAVAMPTVALTGALSITSGGTITQSGALSGTALTAKTLLTAGAAITLDNTGNDFSSIDLRARNTGDTANAPGAISYADATGYDVVSIGTTSTINLIGGDAITQSGTIAGTVLTAKTLNNAGADITLNNAANTLTSVDMRSRNGADTANAAGTLSINVSGALSISNLITTGIANLTSATSIAQTGAITVGTLVAKTLRTAGGAITLNNASNSAGTVNISARNATDTANAPGTISYVGAGGYDVSGAGTTTTISLTSGGIITDSGAIAGTTLTTSSIGGTLLDFGHTITGFTATNTTSGNILLNSVNTATLTLNAITQSGGGLVNVSNNGAMTIAATINTNGGNLILSSAGIFTIGNAGVLNTGAGNTSITSTGAISDSTTGTITTNLLSVKTLNNPGADIILDSGTHNVSAINLQVRNATDTANASGAIDFRSIGGFDVQAANTNTTVLLRSTGAITQSGSMTGNTLTALTLNNSGAAITLNNSGNEFNSIDIRSRNGADSANAAGIITYQDATGFNVSLLATTNSANLIGGDAITQSGTITAPTLTAKTLNNTGAAITFTNTGNVLTNVDLSARNAADTANAAGVLSVYNTGALNIINAATTAIINLTSATSIAQTGAIIAGTIFAKTVRNGGGAITLTNTGNDVGSINMVSRNAADTANSSGALSYTGSTGFDVASIATAGTVNLISDGIISDSGAILGSTLTTSSIGGTNLDFGHTVSGFVATNSSSGDILLNSINTGTLTLNAITQSGGGIVNISNNGAMSIAATINTDNSNLILSSVGNITIGNAGIIDTGTANTTITSTGIVSDSTSGTILTNLLTIKTLNNAGEDIILDNGNHTVSAINLKVRNAADTSNASGVIDFRAASGFDVQAADTTNTVTLRGTDALTQSGSMTGASLTASTLNNTGAAITFNNANNAFASVSLQARNAANTANTAGAISFQNSTALSITTLSTTVDATLVANGAISDTGMMTVGGTLNLTSDGGLALNSVNSINAIHITNNTSGNISVSANSVPLLVQSLTQNSNGTTTISNATGISVAGGSTFTNNGGSITLTATAGDLSVGNGTIINSNGGLIAIAANDLNLGTSGGLNSGSGNVTITQNIANNSIGLGNAAGSMSISNTELSNITATNLNIIAPTDGQILVDGVSAAANNNINSLTLTATNGTTGSVFFQNNASTFKTLTLSVDNNINLAANITASGNIIFGGAAGTTLATTVAITAPNITFNTELDGAQSLILNAGASGTINFNSDVGNITPLNAITIVNANTIFVDDFIYTNTFTQNAGSGTTAFNAQGLVTTGATSIITNNVTGAIDVNSLALGTNLANLTGLIAGGSGTAAIATVTFYNTITAGTHFFNGIDMYTDVPPTPPTPPAPPTPSVEADIAQITLPNGIADYYSTTNNVFTFDAELITLTEKATKDKTCMSISTYIELCR